MYRDTFQAKHLYFHRLRTYVASALFMTSNGWQRKDGGNIVVQKSDEMPTDCILVGFAQSNRLYCGPDGNWGPRFQTSFSTSKYAL